MRTLNGFVVYIYSGHIYSNINDEIKKLSLVLFYRLNNINPNKR